jgi:hypothetical protein
MLLLFIAGECFAPSRLCGVTSQIHINMESLPAKFKMIAGGTNFYKGVIVEFERFTKNNGFAPFLSANVKLPVMSNARYSIYSHLV